MKSIGCLLLVCLFSVVCAQDQFIVMNGEIRADETGRDLKGAQIKAFIGEKLYRIDTTASNGKFSNIKLPIGSIYSLVIEKEGYVSKLATIDATHDESFPPFEEIELKFEVGLFEVCEYSDFDFLRTEPIIIFHLDNSGNITFDREQIKYMMKKVEQTRYSKLKTEERDTFITNYDHALTLMRAEKYPEALPLLVKAKEIVDCPHVLQKLKDCKRELKIQTAYNAHISNGDKFYTAGDFDLAKSAYKNASLLRPLEDYPTNQILQIEYVKVLNQADKYYDSEDYENALKLYDRAIELKPNDTSFKKKHEKSLQKTTR